MMQKCACRSGFVCIRSLSSRSLNGREFPLRYLKGCLRVEYTGKDTAKVMDTVGGVMYVEYKNGEVRECQK